MLVVIKYAAQKLCRHCIFRWLLRRHFTSIGKVQPKIVKWPEWFDFRGWTVHVASAPMHEVSIMTEALRMALDAAKSAGASRVSKLRLRIGSLSGGVPESMRFAFDVVCHDTMAAGALLEIEAIPAACWCATCQAEFECVDLFNECPRCHNISGELRRGRELEIANMEIS
jgi:hydrogenase nickel incorporation protein HypA/HybF